MKLVGVMKSSFRHSTNQWAFFFSLAVAPLLAIAVCDAAAFATPPQLPPDHLRCEELENPIGIDTPQPRLSWQLVDPRTGALQTAYQVQVASSQQQLLAGHADIWDSGRIESDRSVAVAYAGPPLEPEHRYYWRVRAWDKDSAAYPMSAIAWWETGLMQDAWHAQWIGYEEQELHSIRESGAAWISNRGQDNYQQSGDTHHNFRLAFSVDHPIQFAHLYVTGEDTAAAWINGEPVLNAEPLPPYKQTAWKKYVERDVTAPLKQGNNLLAVDVTLFDIGDGTSGGNASRTPMSACLYIRYQDGSDQVIVSNLTWKATLNATGSWFAPSYDDSAWPHAIPGESQGQFTGPLNALPWPTNPVMMLRRNFAISKPIRSARLYATALGAYRFWIDGHPIGDQILAPGWTDYRERVPYQTYDVTSDLQPGDNAIGAYLAPGWYSTPLEWTQEPYNYGNTPPALRSQLHIVYQDGSDAWILTGSEWKAAPSPIEKAEIYDGETYDARLEQSGWAMPRFNDTGWHPVETIQPHELAIVAQDYQPIRIETTLHAKALYRAEARRLRLRLRPEHGRLRAHSRAQGKAGTKIRLRFAEVLNPDGTIYTENLRTALATDYYTMAGRGEESYEPSFTFHGFRYVELTGLPAKPDISAVTAKVIHTAAPFHTQLATSSSMLNQLWSNILWGQRSNFVGVPTDCPQRDERLGWTGDAEVFWRTASYNMGLAPFSRKFAADLRGTQVGTPMYGIYAPGTSVTERRLRRRLERRRRHHSLDFMAAVRRYAHHRPELGRDGEVSRRHRAEQSRLPVGARCRHPLWRLALTGRTNQSRARADSLLGLRRYTHGTDGPCHRPHCGRSEICVHSSRIFRRHSPPLSSATMALSRAQITALRPSATSSCPNKVPSGDTQTGYVLALYMRLVPESLRAAAANRLVQKLQENGWRLGTGFLGTPYLLAVLADTGHADVAYRLLLSTEYPSWGYLVTHGATTMWERWNGDKMRGDPSMNSYNHYAYGAVADWIYRYAAGIDADARRRWLPHHPPASQLRPEAGLAQLHL